MLKLETVVISEVGEYGLHLYYLGDEDAVVIKLGLYDKLIERFGVQLIAGASFHWICQVSYYHVKRLLSLLQLSPACIIQTLC
jgi:hypothetical protein